MNRRRTAQAVVIALAMTTAGSACSDDESSTEDATAVVPDELTVHLVAGAGDDEVSTLILEVLSKPPVPGRQGQDHLDGIQRISGDYRRFAVHVGFFDDATEAEVEAVMSALEASPVVERIELG